MPTTDDVLKLSNSAAAIALLCLLALGFFFYLVARWVGRLIEGKILPVGEAAIKALQDFLGHLRETQVKIAASQDATSSGIHDIKRAVNEHTRILEQIAASNAVGKDALKENGELLKHIAANLEKVCKITDVPCALGMSRLGGPKDAADSGKS